MKKFLIIAAAMIVATSCKDLSPSPSSTEKFENKGVMGLYDSDGNTLFTFNQSLHQIGFIPSARESRIQSDTPEVLFQCRLDKAPVQGSDIVLTLSGKSVTQYAGTYTVRLTKQTGNYIWLYSAQRGYGFILYWSSN